MRYLTAPSFASHMLAVFNSSRDYGGWGMFELPGSSRIPRPRRRPIDRQDRGDLWLAVLACAALVTGIGVSLYRNSAGNHDAGRAVPVAPPVDLAGTPDDTSAPEAPRNLLPVANPDPSLPRQPLRTRPYRVAATLDGARAYVTLAGKEIAPGSEVVVFDVPRRREIGRVAVGSHPYGIALHPTGRWVVVTNRFSNYLSVIDVATDRVVSSIPVPFYAEDLIFAPDGRTVYVSNFWTNQVLVVDLTWDDDRLSGRLRELGFDRRRFFGTPRRHPTGWRKCPMCGWRDANPAATRCVRCGFAPLEEIAPPPQTGGPDGIKGVLRARCGTASCHLYAAGGFYAGGDDRQIFRSTVVHARAGAPELSPLLLAVTATRHGGRADSIDGKHHPGGVVFPEPDRDPDFAALRRWIADGTEGPGISVGDKPRDMAIAPDGSTLYVANTGSLDVSVVDLGSRRETRRIFTRSPVNDIAWARGRLVFATLNVGSGHPGDHDAGRESLDSREPNADFTLWRDPATARPLPLDRQRPLGRFDAVDGTAQEKFRDIGNDIVILDPGAERVDAYTASETFTRYTSDSFEALPGDVKGDLPPDLLRVAGAFPEQIAADGDRLFVSMSGTFEVQEWHVSVDAPPSGRLRPGRVFATGLKPTGLAVAGSTLVVANHLDESVTFVDMRDGTTVTRSVSRLPQAFPATDFERGEFFVQTSVFSVDQDQSCVHCHYRDTSDGKQWSVSQVMGQSRHGDERTGGSREVPDLRALVQKVPFFVEGTLSIDEPLTMMMEHNPLVDFQGHTPAGDFDGIRVTAEDAARYATSADTIVVATGRAWNREGVTLADLLKRRDRHFARISARYLGRAYSFRELQKFIGDYQRGEPRLLPNPVDPGDPMVRHGRALFESPRVGCAGCHPAPAFTDKQHAYNQNRAFPPLVTPAARDDAHTLVSADRIDAINGYVRPWDPDDGGRVEEREGFFVAPSLRGLWARPPRFLHHGHAVSLREVLCTPDHPALGRLPAPRPDADRPDQRERGLNERDGLPDTHGVTSHLTVWDIECLTRYVLSIE